MRILLVDGDGARLQLTRRAFWKAHRGWEVLLAQTGAEALEALDRDAVDVVMADLALTDMGGLELIRRVRERQPGAVRIALAEAGAAEGAEQATESLHRLFLRPFEADFLIGAVESLDIEDDDRTVRAVRTFVGGLGRVPALPGLYSELVALLRREDAGMNEVARVIRKDPGIASQLLKVANSVFCATARPVTEIGQAVSMLGTDSLRSMVLFRGLLSTFDSPRPEGLDLEKLWLHSFEVANGARKLAVLDGAAPLADLAFSVGLLHDLGLAVMATDPSRRYRTLLEQAQSSRVPLAVLEHDTFGVDHAQVGAHLLSLWGLPPEFCRPVREHHAPPATSQGFPLSAALHLADARHGGGKSAGIFADGRWGLHPHVLADADRFARWKACLAETDPVA